MKLVVKNNNGDKFTLQIRPNETFLDLKRRVELESGISLDLRDITSNKRNINEYQRVIDYFLNEQNQQNVQIAQATDVVCAVPTCENKKSLNPDKTYFEFPQEDIRCHQWVLYCRRIAARLSVDSQRANLPINVGAPGTAICSDHFKWDQFVKNTTTLLKRTAVPCVNPELPPTTYPDPARTFTVAKGKSMPMTATSQQANRLPTQSNLTKSTNVTLNNSMASFGIPTAKVTCRLCAQSMRNTVYIYSREGKNLMLAEKINASLPIKVSMTDQLPKQVCRSCIDKVNSAFYLVEISCATDDSFRAKSSDKFTNNDFIEDQGPGSQCPCCHEGELHVIPSTARSTDENNCQEGDNQTGLPNIFFDNDETQQPEEIQDAIDPSQEDDILADYLNIGGTLDEDQEVYVCRICGVNVRSHSRATDHALSHGSDGVFHCTVCEVYYDNPQELVDHFQEHSPNGSQLFCEKCGVQFSSILEISEHRCSDEVIKFDDNTQKKCVLCSKTFTSEQRWQFHMNYHTSTSKGECSICGQTFPSEGKLYRHMLEHKTATEVCQVELGNGTVINDVNDGDTGGSAGGDNDVDTKKWFNATPDVDHQKPYRCEWCGKKFVRRSTLRNHIAAAHRHSQESSCFTCKVCREAFPTTSHAVLHMDSYHNNYVENEPSYSFEMITVTRLYMCEYCEKLFAESSVLHKHRESSHMSTSPSGVFFICKYCNNSFSSHSALQEHKVEHSKQEIPPEYQGEMGVPTTYLCEYCERVFVNYAKYTEHLTIHFGAEPYVCRICGTKYSSLDEVSDHRIVHGDVEPVDDIDLNRPYDCHYCDKTFAIEDALTKHIRMHTGEKPFTCDVCGKGFSQSSGLNTHKKVHSNIRPFSCHLCPRTFKIKGDRDVHIRKHSGQRPFKCEFCFKAFMTQHVYSQHRKIHTGERPYRCDVCHVAFRRSHVLTVHKMIHTGEKPNVCDICGKRYRQKGDMLKHRRSQHGVGRNGAPQSVETSLLNQAEIIDAQELSEVSPQCLEQ